MISKKTEKANLENKKNIFFLLGLIIALGFVLIAFEWDSKPTKITDLGQLNSVTVEEEIIPITREQEIKPPPPPPPPKVIEVFNIVDNDIDIDDELEIEDSEADEDTYIDVTPVIETIKEEEDTDQIYFNFIDEPAEFPGGERALYAYLSKNVNYPVIAQENGVQGKVYLKFVVDKDGSATNIEILRGVDPSLDKEAIRLIESLPKFKPGKQGGTPVRVFYNVVINFMLQ